ncbi:hypothetical protein EON63_00530 [archaeon]|nr:MAG: hypothetical protein EON63_00530 [archaeon]
MCTHTHIHFHTSLHIHVHMHINIPIPINIHIYAGVSASEGDGGAAAQQLQRAARAPGEPVASRAAAQRGAGEQVGQPMGIFVCMSLCLASYDMSIIHTMSPSICAMSLTYCMCIYMMGIHKVAGGAGSTQQQ